MVIEKEDHGRIDDINYQSDAQHDPKNDPWQEEVLVFLIRESEKKQKENFLIIDLRLRPQR